MSTQNPGEDRVATSPEPGTSAQPPAPQRGGFAADVGAANLRDAIRLYVTKVRGGDAGALPAILGLVVMLVVFTSASSVFLTTGNLANLPAQAAGTALIAMGLIFVLLLGEIDLSAGTASGVCAAAMALAVNHNGNLMKTLGGGTFWFFWLLMVVAAGLAVIQRLWPAAAIALVGALLLLTHLGSNQIVAMFIALATGTAIGLLTGFLVARVGIPSFVVTLALFLAWQGVLLQFIGLGNAIPTGRFSLINGLANKNVPPVWGWAFLIVLLGGYGLYTVQRSIRRRAQGLSAEPIDLVLARLAALAVIGAFVMYFLNKNRSHNTLVVLAGMPYVVPIILLLMVFWNLVLSKSSFGRHLYAVGGNAEAARRAGIDVPRMRMAAFALCSSMAALGGIVLASRTGGVPSDAGGGNTLLYAVGAAVIGGTSLFGGRGRARDAVLGAVVIAMIPNGLGLLNLPGSFNFMITGVVLLVAASVDALTRKRGSVVAR